MASGATSRWAVYLRVVGTRIWVEGTISRLGLVWHLVLAKMELQQQQHTVGLSCVSQVNARPAPAAAAAAAATATAPVDNIYCTVCKYLLDYIYVYVYMYICICNQ